MKTIRDGVTGQIILTDIDLVRRATLAGLDDHTVHQIPLEIISKVTESGLSDAHQQILSIFLPKGFTLWNISNGQSKNSTFDAYLGILERDF